MKKYILFILISILTLVSLMFYYINYSKLSYITMSKEMLFQEALSNFKSMTYTRQWNSDHKSVYVIQHDNIKPNPYLEDNILYTKENKVLIKINPAWMTRQISELANKHGDYFFRITSLRPLNPDNNPDGFEKRALLYLKDKKSEKYYTEIAKDKYNFLGSLKVKSSCISCHEEQEYKLNDVIGGLRVSIPIQSYLENVDEIKNKSNILYGITILIAFIIGFITFYFLKIINKRQEIIQKLNQNLESKVKERTKKLELTSKKLKASNAKLIKISTIDYLTKISNRRYFFELGDKLFKLSKRHNTYFCIIAIDIDFFKKVNDHYGHNIGDEVLKFISFTIQNTIRDTDVFARIGGEEFAIILKDTNINGAKELAEKIRFNIDLHPYITSTLKIHCTISLGIVSMNKEDKSLSTLLDKADVALYQAKEAGRNTYRIFQK
ncbi:MAG: hypothetical protein COA66_12580 [Arcobacter sp.]|nr:MAG: hypothetical protein COA66_12580 [Arcobacter sp.]